MARYGQAFKTKVVARLLPPNTASIEEVSREVGVSADTLERWRAEALTTPARERAWSASARLDAVITTAPPHNHDANEHRVARAGHAVSGEVLAPVTPKNSPRYGLPADDVSQKK
jgi:hypothetical protein